MTVGNDRMCCEKIQKHKNLPVVLPPRLFVCMCVCLMVLSKTAAEKKKLLKNPQMYSFLSRAPVFGSMCYNIHLMTIFAGGCKQKVKYSVFREKRFLFFCIINHGVAFENFFQWEKKPKNAVAPERQVSVPLTVGSTDTDVSVLQQSLAISPIRTFYNCSLA